MSQPPSHPPTEPGPPEEVLPTLVETDAQLPTLVEAALEPGISQRGLAPGATIGSYRLVKPLKVTSAEADIWVVEETGEPVQTRILKLYRYGLEPKEEITRALRELRAEHIVPLLGSGSHDGRYYEVQEFFALGSLAEAYAGQAHGEEFARAVLEQLADAVSHLHDAGILHRDIKPANVLVRTFAPLDLVLTDFGISSLAGLSLHLTSVNRTAAYSAPEALTGVVAKASDWWSVGVLLLEALHGSHPFSHMSEQAVNFQLVSKGMPIPEKIQGRWRLLLRGLLVRNHRKRWGMAEIRAWLAGEENLTVAQEEDPFAALQAAPVRVRPYHFGGRKFRDPGELAAALAENWPEALKHFNRGLVTDWVRQDLRDQELAVTLLDISQDPNLASEERLIVGLMALNPELPPIFRGEIITRDWFVQNPTDGINLLRGGVLTWHEELRPDRWMRGLRRQRREGMAFLRKHDIEYDSETANALLFSESKAVREAALNLRDHYVEARHPVLNTLLLQNELSRNEAVLLLAARRDYYRTWQQVQEENRRKFLQTVETKFRTHRIPFQSAKLRKLIEQNHDQVIAQANDYRRTYVGATKVAVAKLLSKPRLELIDALMLLAVEPTVLLDEERSEKWQRSQESKDLMHRLEETQIDLDWKLAESLLEQPDRLPELVDQHHQKFTRARLPLLDAIIRKQAPDHFESLLLVCARHRYFLTPAQSFWKHVGDVVNQVLSGLRRYPISSALGIIVMFFLVSQMLHFYFWVPFVFIALFTYVAAAFSAPPDQTHPDSPYYRETDGLPPVPPAGEHPRVPPPPPQGRGFPPPPPEEMRGKPQTKATPS